VQSARDKSPIRRRNIGQSSEKWCNDITEKWKSNRGKRRSRDQNKNMKKEKKSFERDLRKLII